MITKLVLSGIASYSERIEISPSKVNYFFGGNGSGKSSLTRAIENSARYNGCSIAWETNPLDIYVYNRAFVRANFEQSNELKGIFTLGTNTIVAQAEINSAKVKIGDLNERLKMLNKSLETQRDKLSDEERRIIEKAWSIKVKYDAIFKPAFTGFLKSSLTFFRKIEAEVNNESILLSEQAIREKCAHIFNDNLKSYVQLVQIDYKELSTREASAILLSASRN